MTLKNLFILSLLFFLGSVSPTLLFGDTPQNSPKEEVRAPQKSLLKRLNTGNLEDLTRLSGIGKGRAETILKHRPFESVEELFLLPRFGEKTLQKILSCESNLLPVHADTP